MEKTIKTRITKDGQPVETKLTLNFDGVTREQLEELAGRSIIISTQAVYRTAGKVPAEETVKVAAVLAKERTGGKKATPESLAARILKMPAEERAAFMRLLEGQTPTAPTKGKGKKAEPATA